MNTHSHSHPLHLSLCFSLPACLLLLCPFTCSSLCIIWILSSSPVQPIHLSFFLTLLYLCKPDHICLSLSPSFSLCPGCFTLSFTHNRLCLPLSVSTHIFSSSDSMCKIHFFFYLPQPRVICVSLAHAISVVQEEFYPFPSLPSYRAIVLYTPFPAPRPLPYC